MRRTASLLGAGVLLLIVCVAALVATGRPASVSDIRIEDASAPDPDDRPLQLRIWYPERHVVGRAPLVVISHGAGGSLYGHSDTAIALARAGFVVVAMNHTGDNYRDSSYVGRGLQLVGRPRHVSRTIDYMLAQWPHRSMIDPARIGMFGHSAGGFTALVVAGAEPDLSRGRDFCNRRPGAWTCRYLRAHGYRTEDLGKQRRFDWLHDPRVKAAVIAAPAIGYSFDRAALSQVRIPFQIWAAEKDTIVEDSPKEIRRAFPLAPEYYRVASAGHFSFLEPCGLQMRAIIAVMHWFGTEAICSDPPGFDRTRFHDDLNKMITRYFQRNLRA